MSEWEPATEAEAAMRDALRANDQEGYFRILARTELLLPVSADAAAGRSPIGWGTWTTAGRTHVLAFTSLDALLACLGDNAGATRRLPYGELGGTWPNLEWWLAVNPGLPIEGYLPAWFVSQLARGDARLPTRGNASRTGADRVDPLARARATAAVPGRAAPLPARPVSGGGAAPLPARPVSGGAAPLPARPVSGGPGASASAAPVADPAPASAPPAAGVDHADSDAARPAAAPPSNGVARGELAAHAPLDAAVDAPAGPRANGAAARPAPSPTAGAPVPAAQPSADAPAPAAQPYAEAPVPAAPSSVEAPDFTPFNEVEETLLAAARGGSTNSFLSTLLLAKVLLPESGSSAAGTLPGEEGFAWQTETLDGETYVVVFTSPERLAERVGGPVDTVAVKFVQLIRQWPDPAWSFAVNPGSPIGAKLPGAQIVALASWAAEVGLRDDAGAEQPEPAPVEEAAPRRAYAPAKEDPSRPTMMQKTIAPGQLDYYLERGYDRVSGFVHRANEVAHLATPAQLHAALGLGHAGSPFQRDAEEAYVLRWPAHRPSLYRIPYGGQTEAAMRAMEGWVIERPPFRGNGFAPGDSGDVIAEFKVDSVRLPHGAQLWRIDADGAQKLVAVLDCDASVWRRVVED